MNLIADTHSPLPISISVPSDYTLMVIAATAIFVTVVCVIAWRLKRRQVASGGSISKLAAALHDEKMKSGIIVNAIEDGVVLFDEEGVIRSFNPGAVNFSNRKY